MNAKLRIYKLILNIEKRGEKKRKKKFFIHIFISTEFD